MNGLAVVLATWFGCGYFPYGPGTIGSAAAVLIAWLMQSQAGMGRGTLSLLILVFLFPAVWSATRTAKLIGNEDPSVVVVDEVLGQWLTLLGAPMLGWRSLLLGFALFRLFDIWKPWPIRRFEELPDGVGIVADDLAAGAYAAALLFLGGRLGLN